MGARGGGDLRLALGLAELSELVVATARAAKQRAQDAPGAIDGKERHETRHAVGRYHQVESRLADADRSLERLRWAGLDPKSAGGAELQGTVAIRRVQWYGVWGTGYSGDPKTSGGAERHGKGRADGDGQQVCWDREPAAHVEMRAEERVQVPTHLCHTQCTAP